MALLPFVACTACNFSDDDHQEAVESVSAFRACDGEPITYTDALFCLREMRTEEVKVGRFTVQFKHLDGQGTWRSAPNEAFVANVGDAVVALPNTGDVELKDTSAEQNPDHEPGTYLWFYGDPVTAELGGIRIDVQLVGVLMAWASADERSAPMLWFETTNVAGAHGSLRFKERNDQGEERHCQWKGTTSITQTCGRFVSRQDADGNDVAFSIDMTVRFMR